MAHENLNIDEVRRLAADIGLTRLSDEHLQQLLRATNAARARRAVLQNDTLGYVDEPSHVFSLNTGDAS